MIVHVALEKQFVSRGGLKLAHALDEFKVDVTGLCCADFGSNVGGFTDCLLQRGAAHVFAVDTGYGTLAWKLRCDDRVTVMERTNAMHAEPPWVSRNKSSNSPHPQPLSQQERGVGNIDLITIDLGWTPQRHAIPAALRWLNVHKTEADDKADDKTGHKTGDKRIITLIKPHYELSEQQRRSWLHDGKLAEEHSLEIMQCTIDSMPELGVEVLGHTRSPILGGKSKSNVEYLAILQCST